MLRSREGEWRKKKAKEKREQVGQLHMRAGKRREHMLWRQSVTPTDAGVSDTLLFSSLRLHPHVQTQDLRKNLFRFIF